MEWCNIVHSNNNKHIQGLKLQKINNSDLTLEPNTTPCHWGSQQFAVDWSSDEERTPPTCWCPVLRGQRSQPQLLMSPYTLDVCWAAPGTATQRPLPHRWRPQWSSWCPPGCIARRSSEEGSYCRTDRGQTEQSDTLFSISWFTSPHRRLRLTRCGCPPRWTGRPQSARLTWRWRRCPASPKKKKKQNISEWLNMRPKEPAEATNKRCRAAYFYVWEEKLNEKKQQHIFVWDSVLFNLL